MAASAASAPAVVMVTSDAIGDRAQQALAARLRATGRPLIVVATGRPYDLGLFPAAAAAVATYSSASVSMLAAADVLSGASPPSGRLPVPVAGAATYPFGAGLHY